MRFFLLGTLEVQTAGNRRIHLSGGRQRTLLALLLLNQNTGVSKEQLIDEIWNERLPVGADNALQALATRLRRSLDKWCGEGFALTRLATVQSGYRLHLREEELDLTLYESACAEARRLASINSARAVSKLSEALGYWRGPALQGVSGGVLCRSAAARLNEMRLLTIEEKIDLELTAGNYGPAITELHRMAILNPLHERFSEKLMEALYRVGRVADALDVYQRLRSVLQEELGLDPSPALQKQMMCILKHEEGPGRSFRSVRVPDPGLAGSPPGSAS